jgi:hypothetical protein
MKRPKRKDVATEIKCPLAHVTQPDQLGRKIYPPPCKECGGKGHIEGPRELGR